jgi:RNA polymerase sigma-70 factor, ECF subfamily
MTEPGLGSRPEVRAADVRPERVEIDELLRAVGRGDDAAFARLYDLLAPRVFGFGPSGAP